MPFVDFDSKLMVQMHQNLRHLPEEVPQEYNEVMNGQESSSDEDSDSSTDADRA
eukprot:CAMPEP_0116881310 /NCGR_PEP_ID=MMETSP0463-20121206/13440_1 /TAXON_ID=181622 /ORGANISM="Strombidinopsis sp, Strain SopsisLIS2011" /LENGTH=53 /DNA_ID=CAMNT_0004533163 /DNA_START=1756 /DNA_END=1917 /DNA_ORIENTATION=+